MVDKHENALSNFTENSIHQYITLTVWHSMVIVTDLWLAVRIISALTVNTSASVSPSKMGMVFPLFPTKMWSLQTVSRM